MNILFNKAHNIKTLKFADPTVYACIAPFGSLKGHVARYLFKISVYVDLTQRLMQKIGKHLHASLKQMLASGFWMLDVIEEFCFVFIEHPVSSIQYQASRIKDQVFRNQSKKLNYI